MTKKLKIIGVCLTAIWTLSCQRNIEETRSLKVEKNDSVLVVSLPKAGCENCQKIIEEGLNNDLGIKQTILNLNTKIVSVVYDPKKTTSKIITDKIIDLSYKMPCK
ncbi:MAG: hypothetical protein H0U95_13985 [Bacteroidetes bacterium]|nr:hypothetical protein [Bacteroidota bacterium]